MDGWFAGWLVRSREEAPVGTYVDVGLLHRLPGTKQDGDTVQYIDEPCGCSAVRPLQTVCRILSHPPWACNFNLTSYIAMTGCYHHPSIVIKIRRMICLPCLLSADAAANAVISRANFSKQE